MTAFAVLIAGAGLALGQATPTAIHDQVDRILRDEAYAFCHDKGLALFTLEREYCELVGSENDVCPELPAVCKNVIEGDAEWVPTGRTRFGRDGKDYGQRKTADEGSGKSKGSGSGSGSGAGDDKESKSDRDTGTPPSSKDDPPPKPPPKPEKPPEPIEVPGWLAMMMRLLFYLLVALIVGVIGYLIYKNVMKGRQDDPDREEKDEPAPDEEEKKEVARGPVETDVDRLLARARAAAGRGDFKVAIDDAYAALLRRLEGDGLLDLHPSRTNGDYVRSLRERADLKNAVKGIASDVERVQFGSEAPSPGAFDSIYRRVLPLVGRTTAILLVLFVAGMNASCDAAHAGGRETIAAPAFSTKHVGGTSATGLSAVVELLAANDIEAAFDRPEDDLPEGDNHKAILIMPGTELDSKAWSRLRAWVKSTGGVLIVAGWRKEIGNDFQVDYTPSQGPGPVRPPLPGYGGAAQLGDVRAGRAQLALPHVGALASRNAGPVVEGWVDDQSKMQVLLNRNDEAYAMISDNYFETGAGKIMVFADDRLFANVALALGDNAAYIVALLKGVSVTKLEIWDDVLVGKGGGGAAGNGGAETPLESLANAHLLPIILQLFALVLLYIIYRGTRFGTPKDHKEESRRAFADHTRALGMTYARANASRHAASVFSVWALDRLRERLLGAGRRGLMPLAEAVAARTGRPVGGVMQVLVEASGLRDEVAPPSSFRGSEAAPAYGAGAEQRSAKTEQARHLWIIEQLDAYLAATKGTTKTTGRAAR